MRGRGRSRVLAAVVVLVGAVGAGASPATAHARDAGSPAVRTAPATVSWTRPVPLWQAPSGWSAPTSLTQVVDPSGVVTVAWASRRGATWSIRAARYRSGSWSAPVTVGRSTVAKARIDSDPEFWRSVEPIVRVAARPSGEVVVAWGTGAANVPGLGMRVGTATWTGREWTRQRLDHARPGVLISLSAVADDAGVTVMWQRSSAEALPPSSLRAARGAAGTWSSVTELDDLATSRVQGSPLLVRDAVDGVRAVWLRGSEIVSSAGRVSGWEAREVIGSAASPTSLAASADTEGRVLVAWSDEDAAPYAVRAAARTSTGWQAPATVASDASWFTAEALAAVLGPDGAASVVYQHSIPKSVQQEVASTAGATWNQLAQPESFRSVLSAGPTWFTLDCVSRDWPLFPTSRCWLSSTALGPAGWGPAVSVSGGTGGRVRTFSGAVAPDGTYVLVYGKQVSSTRSGLWSVQLSGGTWTRPVPIVPSRRSARTPAPATPVVSSTGTVSAVWVDGRTVTAAASR